MGLRFSPNNSSGGSLRFTTNQPGLLSSVYTVDWDNISGLPANLNAYLDFATNAEAIAATATDVVMSPARVADEVQGATLFTQTGTGASARTIIAKLKEVFSVKDFGAAGDGSADDTAEIQAAVTACVAAGGGVVFIPRGQYKITSEISIAGSKVHIVGEGMYASEILCGTNTQNGFHFDSSGQNYECGSVRDIGINVVGVTKSAGAAIKVTSWNTFTAERCRIANHFHGVRLTSSVLCWVNDNLMLGLITTNGVGVYIDGSSTSNDHYLNRNFIRGTDASTNCRAGIEIVKTGGTWLYGNSVLWCGTGLMLDPSGTDIVEHIFSTQNAFDTGLQNGITIQPGASATVRRCTFTSDWTATNQNNGVITTGSGTISGIRFIGHRSINNQQYGMVFGAGTDISIVDPICAGNSGASTGTYDAINFQAGVSQWKVIGGRCGPADGFSDVQRYGLRVEAGGGDNYIIEGLDARGNLTGQISDAGTGTSKIVRNNLPEHAQTYRALQTITMAGVGFDVLNTSDAASVQVLKLEGDRATMADGDEAYVSLMLSNDGGTQSEFARLTWIADDVNAGTSIDGSLAFSVATAGSLAKELVLNGTSLSPFASDGLALGTTALMWADAFFASGAVLNFNNGDVTVTHSSDELAVAGGHLRVGSVAYDSTNAAAIQCDTPLKVIHAGSPSVALKDTNGGSDAKYYDFNAGSGTSTFAMRFVNDAFNAAVNWFSCQRSGTTAGATDLQGTSLTLPNLGTTASAANAFLNNAASNSLLRSTSSEFYKKDIEPLEDQYADKILDMEPIWFRSKASADDPAHSFYGLSAEKVASIDPRLCHYGYREDDYEEYDEPQTFEFDVPQMIEIDGELRKVYEKEVRTISIKKRRLKNGATVKPDGVMYDRMVPHLISIIQRLDQRIKNLEKRPVG